jgi:nucleotidyltransferase substrate binding protein (TIGR01987 family)
MALELTSLHKSITALERAIQVSRSPDHFGRLDEIEREVILSGLVQCFEVAYEQSWKMMKRWLETNMGPDQGEGISRRELFRRAAEQGMIQHIEQWMGFHQARYLSSHTYDHNHAATAQAAAFEFASQASLVLAWLEAHND